MSAVTEQPPGLEEPADFWVDVEVPYNKIVKKWDRVYSGKMENHMNNARLQRKVLSIYFSLLGNDDFPNSRAEALAQLESLNMDLVYNLCCQFEFSDGIRKEIIKSHAIENKQEIINLGLGEEYRKNIGEGDDRLNKDGLVALCQLANPDSLRNILVRHKAGSQWPTGIYKRSAGGLPDNSSWEKLIENLSSNRVENYRLWYQFTRSGVKYVAIEEEDRDRVVRQVGPNLEEEVANLVIIRFSENYMDIYSDTHGIASSAQNGVNADISGEEYKKDKNPVSPNDVKEFAETVAENDRSRDQGEDEDIDYIMTAIRVDRTGLSNNPVLKLSSDEGVGTAVKELEEQQFQILSDPKSIKYLKIRFEGKVFKVSQDVEKGSDTTEEYRELIYGTSAQPSTREAFEELLETEFGISAKYKSSS